MTALCATSRCFAPALSLSDIGTHSRQANSRQAIDRIPEKIEQGRQSRQAIDRIFGANSREAIPDAIFQRGRQIRGRIRELTEREPESWPHRYPARNELMATTEALNKYEEISEHLIQGRHAAQNATAAVGVAVADMNRIRVAANTPENQRAAILNRHFAESSTGSRNNNPVGNVETRYAPMLEAVADIITDICPAAGRFAHVHDNFAAEHPNFIPNRASMMAPSSQLCTDVDFVDLLAMMPGVDSNEQRAGNVNNLASMTQSEITPKIFKWNWRHQFFIKVNGALSKLKPRLIQSTSYDGARQDLPSAFLNQIWFGVIQGRSIKKANATAWRARLAENLKG